MFGIDWPIHRLMGTQKDWVDAFVGGCEEVGLNQDDIDKLLYKNFQRLIDKKDISK